MTDDDRGQAPEALFSGLPPESALIMRGRDAVRTRAAARDLVRRRTTETVTVLISSSDPNLRSLDVDGLHIPEAALHRWHRHQIARLQPALVTASAHSRLAAWRARRTGVDAVLMSPVFATRSHPGAPGFGTWRFARLARAAGMPVYALGGIRRIDIARVMALHVIGIAGIGLFAESGGLG